MLIGCCNIYYLPNFKVLYARLMNVDRLLLYLPNFIVSGRGVQNLASSRRRKARCDVLCLIIVVGDIATFTGAL